MRSIGEAAIVTGLLTMLPAFCLAQPCVSPPAGATDIRGSAAQGPVHATKGVVKFVDANNLVIKRSPQQYGREMAFVLNPSTDRVGHVEVGSTVDIRYRTEADQQVATAVTLVHAKQPPSAPGSHQ